MRALITGSDGFVAGYLAASLEQDGHDVHRFSHWQDVRNYDHVRYAFDQARPDLVFHLAAVSSPAEALLHPQRTIDVNVKGTLNVLEAMRATASEAKLLISGSADEYGKDRTDVAELTEDCACFPDDPYGISKLAATHLALSYAKRYGLHAVVTRAWNHTGPGRGPSSVLAAFSQRVVSVEKGLATSVSHGPLDFYVDVCHVSDVIRAYRLAVSLPSGIYNVCSGKPVKLQAVLARLIELSGLGQVETALDPRFGMKRRTGETAAGSAKKLHAATGWAPEIPLDTVLSELLEYWRAQ